VCAPVALGVLSAGAGAAQSIGQYQSASAQAAAQNRSIANQANQRNRQYELETLQGIAEYDTAKIDVERKQDEVGLQFARVASEEQLREDDVVNQYLLQDQDLALKLIEGEQVNEGGRARSSGKNAALAIGRQRGSNVANLQRSRIASKIRIEDARRQADAQRFSLYASVADPYRPGPAPSQDIEFVPGPSPLGLVAGLAGAAVSGASTYNSFAPESQRIGFQPTPTSNTSPTLNPTNNLNIDGVGQYMPYSQPTFNPYALPT
tara:strand:- start:158 stop:946 length:789 start_codon:yes stop_codon:yes gene_type:complete